MNRFTIVRLPTLQAAQERIVGAPDRRVFRGGGIDLIDRMKEGIDAPEQLVELQAVSDELGERMHGIRSAEGRIVFGALVTLAEVADSDLPPAYAALGMAAGAAATPAIRNAATVGGNLLQRPRCWYYRHRDLVCLKKGGYQCFAASGRSRYHAILGGGPSYIVHPSSLASPLLALDAAVVIVDTDGNERAIPIADLFVLPTRDPKKEHTLAAGEVLLEVGLPAPVPAQRSTYVFAKEKQSYDWPLAEATVRLAIRDGLMRDVRVVLGHVAPVPWRSPEAEKILEGQRPDPAVFATAADAALRDAKPLKDNHYKVPLAKNLVREALHRATDVPLPE